MRDAEPDDAAEDTPDTAAARADIEQTRADMSSTIDAIQDKLDPEVLSEQAKDTAHDVTDYAIREAKVAARELTEHAIEQARTAVQEVSGQASAALREATVGKAEHMARSASETAGGVRHTLVETIKANPLPAAVAGLSIGWLYFNRSSGYPTTGYQPPHGYTSYQGDAYRYPSAINSPTPPGGLSGAADQAPAGVGQVTDRVQQTAGQVSGQVQDAAGQVVGQVQETSGQVVEQVQHQAARAQGFLQQQLDQNPLVVGAVTIALGGVLAAMMRPTPQEDELFGETRDRLVGSAQQLTQETMHKVGQVVDQAQTAAKQEAHEQNLLPADDTQMRN